MKKLITYTVLASAIAAFSMPGPHSPGFRGTYGPRVHHAPYHRHHHSSPFWTGVGVGLVGSLVAPAILPPPPPPLFPPRVWIPARTETRYDAYGRPYVVTIPGYWQY